MAERRTESMRNYWEERAKLNAAYFVDTTVDYDAPDMEKFLADGFEIVRVAMEEGPVSPEQHRRAVDIGCGLGRISLALRERFDHVTGYDIAPEMLKQAGELVAGRDGIDLRLTDGASLPGTEDRSTDFVVTFTVFQHIPDVDVIRAYIREAGRILAPGGVFAFQWNNTPGAQRWTYRRAVMSVVQRLGFGDEHGRDRPEFLGSRVDLAVIDAALADGGLKRVGLKDPGQLLTWAWAVRAD